MQKNVVAWIAAIILPSVALPASAEVQGYAAGWQIERLPQFRACSMTVKLDDSTLLAVIRSFDDPASDRLFISNASWSLPADPQINLDVALFRHKFQLVGKADRVGNGSAAIVIALPHDRIFDLFNSGFGFVKVSYEGKTLVSYAPRSREMDALIAVNRCVGGFRDPFAK